MLEDQFHLPSISAKDALSRMRGGTTMIDLRKPVAIAKSGKRIRSSLTRDPFAFDHGDPLMTTTEPVITFCVHGHEVSQFACALLMLHGRDVHYVTGGFEALVAAGADLEDIER